MITWIPLHPTKSKINNFDMKNDFDMNVEKLTDELSTILNGLNKWIDEAKSLQKELEEKSKAEKESDILNREVYYVPVGNVEDVNEVCQKMNELNDHLDKKTETIKDDGILTSISQDCSILGWDVEVDINGNLTEKYVNEVEASRNERLKDFTNDTYEQINLIVKSYEKQIEKLKKEHQEKEERIQKHVAYMEALKRSVSQIDLIRTIKLAHKQYIPENHPFIEQQILWSQNEYCSKLDFEKEDPTQSEIAELKKIFTK